jgi:hypothetical protein
MSTLPRRHALLFLLFAMPLLALTSCAQRITSSTGISPDLLACDQQPEAPISEDDRDLASYILTLAAAGDDCRTKLGLVGLILSGK